jgi:hypothetical protein
MTSALLKAYYLFKPIVPRSMQISLRRRLASYQRRLHSDTWPIDPASATAPADWPGWPDGKHFAFILSHDVDTRKGYEDVLKLAAIEEKLGFRSTFNFVPERYGEISLELIAELRKRGFGVGVHGLKHDGKLFFSKRTFNKRAEKINGYLKKWHCRGFSSPSMHHRQDWLNVLDIDYSISTFDTDPFEPQPDGVATIFPIMVENETTGNGYVELPYTMPQDSTLFLILQEKTINIWKTKLDWIVKHGGMALVNTHTDYMDFIGDESDCQEYSIEFYIGMLNYLKEKYKDTYWHPLSIDMAHFWLDKGRCYAGTKKRQISEFN